MSDPVLIIIPIFVFGTVGAGVFLFGQYHAIQAQTQRRLRVASTELPTEPIRGIQAYIAQRFDERGFRIGAERRESLRRKLQKAGYFGAYAVNYYIFVRTLAVVLATPVAFAISEILLIGAPFFIKVVFFVACLLVAIAGPDAYLSRRQRFLTQRYRLMFPDLLDLLLVCVDAGLSLEVAFARVTSQMLKQNRELGGNLELMGAEMRAGRSMIQALESFADRLGLDEAASLTTMLRQSIEFGSDVSEALRVFSDEMREKRLLRAEEAANKLSVKMVLPLGVFIFPVVLMVIMLPVAIKLMSVLR